MNNNNQHDTTGNWGQSIINDFLEGGGFQQLESKQTAHEKFQHLIATDYDPDDVWDQRCNALAVWALICIELEVPSQELELLCVSITSAMERLPNGEHPLWLGQLAFDLIMLKFSDSPNVLDFNIATENLFRIIKQAAKSFQAEPRNKDRDFFQEGKIDPDHFGRLLGVETQQNVRHLSGVQKLLIQCGNTGVNEALYLLVILGMGDSNNRERWLKRAVDGAWPTKQLAAFYLGFLLLDSDKGKGECFLKKVTFPPDEDPDFEVLIELALKAKRSLYLERSLYPKEKAFAKLQGNTVAKGWQKNNRFYDQSRSNKAKYVSDQWETVERCVIRLQDVVGAAERNSDPQFSELELPEHIRSLTLESGRLVEVFLKWCLSEWFADGNKLDKTIPLSSCRVSECNEIIGPILGNDEDGGTIGLRELLNMADIRLPDDSYPVDKLIGVGKKSWEVWGSKVNFATFVIANAVAAKCNEYHPFRHTPKDSLAEALGIFNAVYFVRNANAHYSDPQKATSANEAIFWGIAVWTTVDQFMASYVRLPRRSAMHQANPLR